MSMSEWVIQDNNFDPVSNLILILAMAVKSVTQSEMPSKSKSDTATLLQVN